MSSSPTETSVAVLMPQMGVSVAEGTIVEWHKRPGDWVEADEMICDITTDKIDVEVPAPATGRLAKIVAEPGDTVPVGEPIAEIDTGAKPGEAHPEEEHRPEPKRGNGEIDRSEFYSPVVRRMATEHGIDLTQVEGTGIGGRVRKRDLVAFLERGTESQSRRRGPSRCCTASRRMGPMSRRRRPASGASPCPRCARRSPAHGREPARPRRTARRSSRRTSRGSRRGARELRETMERRGVKLTYLAFVARATVEALEEFPRLNSSVDGRRGRPPRRRQPRDRGGARRRPDRAGDPPGAAAEPRGPRGERSRTSQAGRASASWPPTTSTAARSRSPTRASSAPSWRRRSSTSRRWRSSTSRRS